MSVSGVKVQLTCSVLQALGWLAVVVGVVSVFQGKHIALQGKQRTRQHQLHQLSRADSAGGNMATGMKGNVVKVAPRRGVALGG